MVERSLIVLKPDAIARGLVGEIISRFEKIGLKIVGMKMMRISEELADKHYPADREEFITGMGHKTLDNYKELGKDPQDDLGTNDPHKIGLMIHRWTVEFMRSGPVIAAVLEGPHAVELIRKIRGHTLPLKALPGTITGDLSFDSSALGNLHKRPIRNLVHASGTVEEANFEVALWFTPDELFDYDAIHHAYMID